MASTDSSRAGTSPNGAAAATVDAMKVYGSGSTEVRALDGVTVAFDTARFSAIMGPSGSGKSTLLHCIAGLDSLTSGVAFIGDTDLSELDDNDLTVLRRDRVGFIFQVDTGGKELTVALIYGESQPAGDWLLGTETFEANVDDQYDYQVFVRKADGVDTPTARAAIEQVADGYPGAKVLDQSGYEADQTMFIDQLLNLIYVMLLLAIFIALLGIANTLALSIIERTRELGMMRAVGMTRSQLRSMIRWESVIIAIQGTLLGIVVGVFFGWALVTALSDEGIETFRLPVATLVVVVVLAALAGVLAAVWPARRAAKLDVLRAVVTE
jgi:ABC-type antimicrobial peptide transport system permease subunit